MSPIQGGIKRLRGWYFGDETVHGTPVAGTSRKGWTGAMVIEPNWTDQDDLDVGSIDTYLPPFRTQTDVTADLSGNLVFDDIPAIMDAGVRGGVSAVGAGAAKTWTHTALSLTATTLGTQTGYWGDDVTADGMRGTSGVEESIELGFDESLAPWQYSGSWRFSAGDAHVAMPGLTIGSNLALVFGADTALYIDDTAGAIGGTQISDAVHRASIKIDNTIDQKRFANGSNTRFAISGYALAERELTVSVTFAKSTAITNTGATNEITKWLSTSPTARFLRFTVISQEIITGATPYSWNVSIPGDWRTRTDEEVGGNTVITLELKARYNATLAYIFNSVVICSKATLP